MCAMEDVWNNQERQTKRKRKIVTTDRYHWKWVYVNFSVDWCTWGGRGCYYSGSNEGLPQLLPSIYIITLWQQKRLNHHLTTPKMIIIIFLFDSWFHKHHHPMIHISLKEHYVLVVTTIYPRIHHQPENIVPVVVFFQIRFAWIVAAITMMMIIIMMKQE